MQRETVSLNSLAPSSTSISQKRTVSCWVLVNSIKSKVFWAHTTIQYAGIYALFTKVNIEMLLESHTIYFHIKDSAVLQQAYGAEHHTVDTR